MVSSTVSAPSLRGSVKRDGVRNFKLNVSAFSAMNTAQIFHALDMRNFGVSSPTIEVKESFEGKFPSFDDTIATDEAFQKFFTVGDTITFNVETVQITTDDCRAVDYGRGDSLDNIGILTRSFTGDWDYLTQDDLMRFIVIWKALESLSAKGYPAFFTLLSEVLFFYANGTISAVRVIMEVLSLGTTCFINMPYNLYPNRPFECFLGEERPSYFEKFEKAYMGYRCAFSASLRRVSAEEFFSLAQDNLKETIAIVETLCERPFRLHVSIDSRDKLMPATDVANHHGKGWQAVASS